jgi:hypothetical protein
MAGVPLYINYRKRMKIKKCIGKLPDGRKCEAEYETSNPARKYCDECRKTKTWTHPSIKRL